MTAKESSNIYKLIGYETDSCTITELVEKYKALQQENTNLKMQIEEATKYIEENSDYEEFGDDYTSVCEKIFEGDVDELLSKLKEVKK